MECEDLTEPGIYNPDIRDAVSIVFMELFHDRGHAIGFGEDFDGDEGRGSGACQEL